MVEIAPHQYGHRKIFRLRKRPDDSDQPGMTAAADTSSAEIAEPA
jgi:hypothetical protein